MSSKKLIETSNSGGDGDYGSLRPQDLEERSSSERLQRRRSSLAELGDSLASIGTSMRNGLRGSLVFSGSNCSIRELGGNSTISKSTFNLIKNLVGAGVLSLPSGVCVTIPVIAASLLLLVDVLINLFFHFLYCKCRFRRFSLSYFPSHVVDSCDGCYFRVLLSTYWKSL